MKNLLECIEESGGEHSFELHELRLKEEPAMILLFTQDVEDVLMHYEKDEAVRSYFICPGENCPHCYLGSAPKQFYLLPVYCIESGDVEVLRISLNRGPGTLAGCIKPFLKDPEITNKVLMISRNGTRYKIVAQPIAEKADRGLIEIKAFKRCFEEGLKLESAFPKWTASELAEVDRLRKKLNAIDGYPPKEESNIEKDGEENSNHEDSDGKDD